MLRPSVTVSRSTFLKACGVALLGVGVDTSALTAVAAGFQTDRTDGGARERDLRMDDARASLFLPHVNTPFTVRRADGPRVELVLTKVVEGPATKAVDQFSLIFHAPGAAVQDGTYAFHHPALGDFNLFIVSVGAPRVGRAVYQACFSRHIRM
jgi:hypothetical protein